MSHNNPKNILVAGGAGYIGSHTVYDLKQKGFNPIIIDNFSTGNLDLAKKLGVEILTCDLDNKTLLKDIFKKYSPVAVMHFAAFAYVGESVTEPLKYYRNNFAATLSLIEIMKEFNVTNFIFSSTCATYGTPKSLPITEDLPQNPINPYGFTKLAVERMLFDSKAWGLNAVIFRYFNASGASTKIDIGERHDPETHLIPLVINSALYGDKLKIFGNDYSTKDGTCVRDYIHVEDISAAHILGLEYLLGDQKTDYFNIGTEHGYSVMEVINCVEKITGKKVNYEFNARRAGDPAELVASAKKIKETLGWKPQYTDLEKIVGTAVKWHLKEPRK